MAGEYFFLQMFVGFGYKRLAIGLTSERIHPRENLEENDAQTSDVGRLPIVLFFQ